MSKGVKIYSIINMSDYNLSILYIFFTHELNFKNVNTRIKNMMNNLNTDDYIIVKGIEEISYYDKDNKLLNINCNDKYEGLPEKVFKTYKYIINNSEFDNYNYFIKLDDDMIVNKLICENEIRNYNYCGKVNVSYDCNRKWHIGKCSSNSIFNTVDYSGKVVPWCYGGIGYIISRYAIHLIENNTNYKEHIYEDLYIALLLNECKIHPIDINIQAYVISPDHK